MRIFGHYVRPTYGYYRNDEAQEGCGFFIILILIFTFFSVLNPVFLFFWIPALIGASVGKKIAYKNKNGNKRRKQKDYE